MNVNLSFDSLFEFIYVIFFKSGIYLLDDVSQSKNVSNLKVIVILKYNKDPNLNIQKNEFLSCMQYHSQKRSNHLM